MKNSKKKLLNIETLSAYLDDELQPEEKKQFQSRLSTDKELRQQLEDLRQTRAALRSTPQVRRPRSFVLTPEMVRQQRSVLFAVRFSRLVSVAAMVLFAFVFAGQLFFGRGGSFALAPQAASAPVEEQAAQDNSVMTGPVGGGGGMGNDAAGMAPAAGEDEAAEEPEMAGDTALSSAETETPQEVLVPTGTPALPASEADMGNTAAATEGALDDTEPLALPPQETLPTPTVVPPSTETERVAVTSEGETDGQGEPSFMVMPTEVQGIGGGGAETTPMTTTDQAGKQTNQKGLAFPLLGLVQGGLLLLALLSGGLFFFFRRKLK